MNKLFNFRRFDSDDGEKKIVILPSELESVKTVSFEEGKSLGYEEGQKTGYDLGYKDSEEKNKRLNDQMLNKIADMIKQNVTVIDDNNKNFFSELEKEFIKILTEICNRYFLIIEQNDFSDSIIDHIKQLFGSTKINNLIVIETNMKTHEKLSKKLLGLLESKKDKILFKVNDELTMYDVKIYNEEGCYERNLNDIKKTFYKMFEQEEEPV